MKKFSFLLIAILIFSALSVSAHVGDTIGYALYTDIVARINGYDIASFNVDGNTYVIAEDLSAYGFDVNWNSAKRQLTIRKSSHNTVINPTYVQPFVQKELIGTPVYPILETDIITVSDKYILDSYNINGLTIIPFDNLSMFGKVVWDNSTRRIELTLPEVDTNTINEKNTTDVYTLNVAGKKVFVGMSASDLGTPDEILPSNYDFSWYVYGTETYEDFFAAGVCDGVVNALVSSGKGFDYNGYICGGTIPGKDRFSENLYTDVNSDDKIHAVMITQPNQKYKNEFTAETLAGESKLIFHLTNAFRIYHGAKPFEWSTKAQTCAVYHAGDMAEKNYFSHTSTDGTTMSQRIDAAGIKWLYCGENIAAGNKNGFLTYTQWVESTAHRENLLDEFTHLGVGSAYNPDTIYGTFYVQNFYR